MFWGVALLAYGYSVFGGPLRPREETGNLNQNSFPLNIPDFTDFSATMPFNPSSLFTLPDTRSNNANWPSDLPITSPTVPSDIIASTTLLSSQPQGLPQQDRQKDFRALFTLEVGRSFLKIRDGGCRYGLYNLSPDLSKFVFSVCGQSWDWESFRDAIYDSNQPGFAIRPLEVGRILDSRILVVDYLLDPPNFDFGQENTEAQQKDDLVPFLRAKLLVSANTQAWLNAVKAAFPGRKVINLEFSDPVNLLNLGPAMIPSAL